MQSKIETNLQDTVNAGSTFSISVIAMDQFSNPINASPGLFSIFQNFSCEPTYCPGHIEFSCSITAAGVYQGEKERKKKPLIGKDIPFLSVWIPR